MQINFRNTISVLAILAASGAAPALAQDLDIGEVVVTANKTPTEKSKVGSTVTVITKKDIDKESKATLNDYLTLVPGMNVSSPGGMGQESSLSLRGADKKYIKTLFNGIDISDPTSTQVQTPYQNLLIGGIGSVEVLKGSQSTLYGSDAIAGVIGISTLTGIEPGIHQEISGEGGSFGTWRGGYSLSGADDTGKAALGIYGLDTAGISAALVNGAPAVDSNPSHLERDGFQDFNINFAGEKQITDYFSVFGAALYINAKGDYDDSGNPPTDNTFNRFDTQQKAARLGFNLDLLDGRLKNTFAVQASQIDRGLNSVSIFGPYDADFRGERTKAEYQGSFEASRWLTLQYGADYERQSAHATDNFGTDTNESFNIGGLWGQAVVSPVENLTLTAGLRHDEHSEFGGHTTYRLTGSYSLPDYGTRFHSSYGTGFRSPSLYELYDPFAGNSALRPEESKSFDIGVEQTFLDGRFVGDVTYFMLDTDNLIDYDYTTSRYVQLPGTTHRNGVEVSLSWAATSWLDLGASYTYTHTRQPDGERRPRIPEHDFAIAATVRPAEKWAVTGVVHTVLNTVDRISPSFGTFVNVPLDDYVLVDAKVSYKPTEATEIYLRGENLLDQKYEVVKGYGTPGLGVFAGFKATF
ncbi:TonB-dependent receptor plug domain-containing protein [Mesorhizobium koreense]|uniref:TonB-dependent receptor plug domain-containing protein n=1 Tax=Mesorhizobium koreense TaxID=3074855 RepID=UPI00287B9DCF|nr:TonB-dependent receptor [Mesorhizobium sp. WR6]